MFQDISKREIRIPGGMCSDDSLKRRQMAEKDRGESGK